MSSSVSSNRYSPLRDPDEVRIEMEELPPTQASKPQWQDSTREVIAAALGSTSPPPIRLETKPPPRRGMSWPIFGVKKNVNVHGKLHEDWQKTRAAMEPELRERPSLVEVSDCMCSFCTSLTYV